MDKKIKTQIKDLLISIALIGASVAILAAVSALIITNVNTSLHYMLTFRALFILFNASIIATFLVGVVYNLLVKVLERTLRL